MERPVARRGVIAAPLWRQSSACRRPAILAARQESGGMNTSGLRSSHRGPEAWSDDRWARAAVGAVTHPHVAGGMSTGEGLATELSRPVRVMGRPGRPPVGLGDRRHRPHAIGTNRSGGRGATGRALAHQTRPERGPLLITRNIFKGPRHGRNRRAAGLGPYSNSVAPRPRPEARPALRRDRPPSNRPRAVREPRAWPLVP